MLVDFDWCGKVGEARYPVDINLDGEIDWHKGVVRGGKLEIEHDLYLLKALELEEDPEK